MNFMAFDVCIAIVHARNPNKNNGMSYTQVHYNLLSTTMHMALVLHSSTSNLASTIYMHKWHKEFSLSIYIIVPPYSL